MRTYDDEEEEEEEDLLHAGPLEDLVAEGGGHPLLHPLLVVLVQVVEPDHLPHFHVRDSLF